MCPEGARANAFDLFGFNPRGLGMGGAQVAAADDFTASYYNPALLVEQRQAGVGLGFLWARPAMSLRASPGVNLAGGEAPAAAGTTFGALIPLAGKLKNKLALGLSLYLPTSDLLRVRSMEPSVPTWYLYDSYPNRLVLAAGVGASVTDWLELGLGAQVIAGLSGVNLMSMDVFSKAFGQRTIQTDMINTAAPIAGLALKLAGGKLKLALAYRSQIRLDYALPTTIELQGIGTMTLDLRGTAHWSPHQFAAGLSYQLGPSLLASADLTYARWSKAPDPAVKLAVGFSGDVINGLGLDKALSFQTVSEPLGFEDIVIPRVGMEYRASERVALRGGFFYRPTFIPKQSGETNYLDAPVYAGSASVGVAFRDPLELFEGPLQADLGAQFGFLPERRAEKGPDSPVPSYSYGGWTSSVVASLRYNY